MSNAKTGVGTQDIIIDWYGGDTAQENVFRYSYWSGDTAHNTTYYSESGGTPQKKMCSDIYTVVGTC